MLRINDPQKHKVFYTWELYDVIINFHCVQDLVFLRIIHSEHSELSANFTACRKFKFQNPVIFTPCI